MRGGDFRIPGGDRAQPQSGIPDSRSLGHCKLLTGSLEETIPLVEKAMRLSPRDPHIYMWYKWIGVVHLLKSRIDEAIVWLEKARTANPAHPLIRAHLASAYGLKDAAERGAAELGEARKLSSDGRFSSIARLKAAQYLVAYDLSVCIL